MPIENPTDEQITIAFGIIRAGYIELDNEIMPINERIKNARRLEREKINLLLLKSKNDSLSK